MIGITMPVALGMLALGSEITFLLYKQRQMQSVADAAALDAATAVQTGHPAPAVEALGTSGFLGFVNGDASGTTVTVNIPPLSGAHTGNNSAVEVIITQPQTLILASFFHSGLFGVTARAVAIAGSGADCVLQLYTGASPGVTISNGAIANFTQCGLAVDSTANAALSMSGGAVLNAPSVSVAGKASVGNGAVINPSSALKTSQPNVTDPYAGVAMPTFSGCSNGTSKQYSGIQTVSPGVWCNGVSFANGAIITMNPGVYFVNGGTFNVGGGATMTGTGVTIVLTSSTGSNYATATIGNGAIVTLSAPTTGATAGMVFFGDRNAPESHVNTLGGGAVITVTGVLYFPSQTLNFQNGAASSSVCTQIVAGTLTLTGGAAFQNNCPAGVSAIGATKSVLAE